MKIFLNNFISNVILAYIYCKYKSHTIFKNSTEVHTQTWRWRGIPYLVYTHVIFFNGIRIKPGPIAQRSPGIEKFEKRHLIATKVL